MWSSRRWPRPCSRRRLPPRSKWCAKATPKFIRKTPSRRSTCASVSAGSPTQACMTHKKTHKESESMPSAAKKLSIVHNDTPEAVNDVPQDVVQELEVVEVTDAQPSARPEELRLLEALLFAAD